MIKKAKKFLYKLLGLFFLGLGMLGIALPLLPTVPLWIVAAIFFAGSSPALQQKIYRHPQLGETIRRFVEEGTLSRRSKFVAIAGATGGSLLSLTILIPPKTVVLPVVVLISATVYWIATRPETQSVSQE